MELPPIREVTDVAKEYIIGNQLGSGSMGVVFKAYRIADRKVVALKKITHARVSQKDIQDEFAIMQKLSAPENVAGAGCHIGIVCYYDLFYSLEGDKKVYYVTMQYLPGADLFDVLGVNRDGLGEADLAKMMKHVLRAVDYIHSNRVAHLDLKLENIRMSEDKFYIIDFGFACMIPINTCGPRGTPNYADPILRLLSAGIVENLPFEAYLKADIWSLGVVFLELATGNQIQFYWPDRQPFFDKLIDSVNKQEDPPEVPDFVFRRAFKNVNPVLAKIIKSMFIVDYSYRPGARDLMHRLDDEYFQ